MRFYFLLLFLTSMHSLAVASTFRYFTNGNYTNVEIVNIANLKVNEFCRSKAKCKAVIVANGKPFKAERSSGPVYHNAGASYCWDVGAKNRILKDAKNNEYDFCVFDDGSMIDAWNLYSKHYPTKRIK